MKQPHIRFNPTQIILFLLFGSIVSITSCKSDEVDPFIRDTDGNRYTSIQIGDQTWMVENLRTTHYRNGDAIPNVQANEAWDNLRTGGYSIMMSDTSFSNKYGMLYNWYAVEDPRGIGPEGWHVPTNVDWTELIEFLGGEEVAGGRLKMAGTEFWCDPNVAASNSSGFSALPGGARNPDFLPGCDWGFWWSADGFDSSEAYNYILFDSYAGINEVYNGKRFGMSVRLLKDKKVKKI